MILVDGGQLGETFASERRVVPFLEREGEYWGPPPDDRTAIAELDRLRQRGAAFVVFAWPALWWLGHYAALRYDLERRFTCVLKNERLVIFDLRVQQSGAD